MSGFMVFLAGVWLIAGFPRIAGICLILAAW